MCRAMPFSARALLALWIKNIFFDVDIVAENKSKCGLSWSVLLSTTSTRHNCMLNSDFAKVFESKVWRIQVDHLLICIKQRVHFRVRIVNRSPDLDKDFCRYLWYCGKKKQIECRLAWHWWNSTDLGLIDMFLCRNCRATSRIWKVPPTFGFSPDLRKKWRCSEPAHASYSGLSFRIISLNNSGFSRIGKTFRPRLMKNNFLNSRFTENKIS